MESKEWATEKERSLEMRGHSLVRRDFCLVVLRRINRRWRKMTALEDANANGTHALEEYMHFPEFSLR